MINVFFYLIFILVLSFLIWCYVQIRKFEPLKSFPGPKPYPIIGNLLDIGHNPVDFLENLLELTNLYKPTAKLWLGPNCYLVTTDPNLMELILGSPKYLKKSADYELFKCFIYNGLITSTGSYWQKRRKMLNPAFHIKALESFNSIFNDGGDELIGRLSNKVSEGDFDIHKIIALFAVDVLIESIMGIPLKSQESENTEYQKNLSVGEDIIVKRVFSLFKRSDILFKFTSDYRMFQNALKFGYEMTQSTIEKRRKKLLNDNNILYDSVTDDTGIKKKKIFLDILLSSKIDGEPLSDIDILQEINTMTVAGFNTTSALIGFTLYELSRNPDIQNKVFKEIKTVFSNNKNYHPTFQDYNNMPYLELVLKESLRLYPPAPCIARQLEEDVNFEDKIIPKDTIIVFSLYGMHRREDLYPNSKKFEPERFISGKASSHPYSFLPFSGGPRKCIAYKYGLLQAKCAVSRILMNFEILPPDGEYNMKLANELALKPVPGIFVKLQDRKLID